MNWQNRNFLFVSLFLLSFGIATYTQQKSIEIEFPKFPISANKEYLIRIYVNKQNISFNENVLNALVFEIYDGKMKERAIINYGFENIDKTFQGQNVIIRNWRKYDDLGMIVVNISFNKIANNKMLKIYHISPLTNQHRQDLLENLIDKNSIFSSLVSLLIPPKLDLFIRSADGNIGELALNKIGFAVCRAYEGEPFVRPMWVNLHEFIVKSSNYSADKNERELQFNVSIDNHLKEIHCKAGDSSKSTKLFVFHPPSQIVLKPEFENYVQKGSEITCSALNGYPVPEVRWNFKQGPPGSHKFFTISKDGKTLYMKLNTPTKTHWKFSCTATNIYPGNLGQFSRNISFIVEDKANQKNISFNTSALCSSDFGSIFRNEFRIYNEKLEKDLSAIKADVARLRNNDDSCTNKEPVSGGQNIQSDTNSSFEWLFEKFYSQRILYSTFPYYTSNVFAIPNKNLKLRIYFNHNVDNKFVILRFNVYVFPISFIPLKYEHDAFNASVEICNANNLNLCKRISKVILKNVPSQYYDFLYQDLAISGIFYADSVLIKCFIQ